MNHYLFARGIIASTLLFCMFIWVDPMHAQLITRSATLESGLELEQAFPDVVLKDANNRVHCLVMVEDNAVYDAIMQLGARVQTRLGSIATVQVTADRLPELMQISGVIAVELPNKANSAKYMMDSARALLQIDRLHSATEHSMPHDYTGEGVVIGVVDIGFQHKHPAFLSSDSSRVRISRVWQQNFDLEPPPSGFDYGSEYVGDKIFWDGDWHGTHGTHVAGIASGSGIGSPNLKYKGIAPDAELVFVCIKHYDDDIPPSALSDYVIANPAIIDAYQYIFDYAQSVGKPAVINLSWGMHTGPHDGTSLFDLATERLTGSGKILVGAAGNYGDNPMHFEAALRNDTVHTLATEWNRLARDEEQLYLDYWGSGNSFFELSVSLLDSFGNTVYQSPYMSSSQSGNQVYGFDLDSGRLNIAAIVNSIYVPNQKPNITLWISNPNPEKYVVSVSATSPFCNLHAWNSGGIYRYSAGSFVNRTGSFDLSASHISGNTNYTVGENGGTSKAVISVGAFAAKNQYIGLFNDTFNNTDYVQVGDITPFSSKGPTVDGRIKPDLVAPGMDVAAPIYLEQYPGWAWSRLVAKDHFKGDTFAYGVFSGTSMAAPQVAGTVALMLQANPRLNPLQVRKILTHTALQDVFTGQVPNPRSGWGKLNSFDAVVEALRVVSANKPKYMPQSFIAYPNPASQQITVESQADEVIQSVHVMNIEGKSVWVPVQEITNTKYLITTQHLAAGLYLLHINNQVIRIAVY